MLTPIEDQIVSLTLGRIFRMGARPSQPGDLEEYERCRRIIVETMDPQSDEDRAPNWVRDRLKGAAGDA